MSALLHSCELDPRVQHRGYVKKLLESIKKLEAENEQLNTKIRLSQGCPNMMDLMRKLQNENANLQQQVQQLQARITYLEEDIMVCENRYSELELELENS